MKGTIHKRIMNDFKPKEAPRLYITIKNISPDTEREIKVILSKMFLKILEQENVRKL